MEWQQLQLSPSQKPKYREWILCAFLLAFPSALAMLMLGGIFGHGQKTAGSILRPPLFWLNQAAAQMSFQ
jgi:hypothetical protein